MTNDQRLLLHRRQGNWWSLVAGDRDFGRYALGGGHEGSGGRRSGIAHHERHTGIAAFADGLINGDAADERHAQLLRHLFPAATAEYVGFMAAVRANEMAHVLDDP